MTTLRHGQQCPTVAGKHKFLKEFLNYLTETAEGNRTLYIESPLALSMFTVGKGVNKKNTNRIRASHENKDTVRVSVPTSRHNWFKMALFKTGHKYVISNSNILA